MIKVPEEHNIQDRSQQQIIQAADGRRDLVMALHNRGISFCDSKQIFIREFLAFDPLIVKAIEVPVCFSFDI